MSNRRFSNDTSRRPALKPTGTTGRRLAGQAAANSTVGEEAAPEQAGQPWSTSPFNSSAPPIARQSWSAFQQPARTAAETSTQSWGAFQRPDGGAATTPQQPSSPFPNAVGHGAESAKQSWGQSQQPNGATTATSQQPFGSFQRTAGFGAKGAREAVVTAARSDSSPQHGIGFGAATVQQPLSGGFGAADSQQQLNPFRKYGETTAATTPAFGSPNPGDGFGASTAQQPFTSSQHGGGSGAKGLQQSLNPFQKTSEATAATTPAFGSLQHGNGFGATTAQQHFGSSQKSGSFGAAKAQQSSSPSQHIGGFGEKGLQQPLNPFQKPTEANAATTPAFGSRQHDIGFGKTAAQQPFGSSPLSGGFSAKGAQHQSNPFQRSDGAATAMTPPFGSAQHGLGSGVPTAQQPFGLSQSRGGFGAEKTQQQPHPFQKPGEAAGAAAQQSFGSPQRGKAFGAKKAPQSPKPFQRPAEATAATAQQPFGFPQQHVGSGNNATQRQINPFQKPAESPAAITQQPFSLSQQPVGFDGKKAQQSQRDFFQQPAETAVTTAQRPLNPFQSPGSFGAEYAKQSRSPFQPSTIAADKAVQAQQPRSPFQHPDGAPAATAHHLRSPPQFGNSATEKAAMQAKLSLNIPRTEEAAIPVESRLEEPEHDVIVKLSDIQADPDNMLYSVKSLEDLGLSQELLTGLLSMGFRRPSKIQEKALPLLMMNPPQNLIGQSQSGTGKTAAFVLNILHRIDLRGAMAKVPQALILTPTRELARQIVEVVESMGRYLDNLTVTTCIPMDDNQHKKLEFPVIVGTPGTVKNSLMKRLLDRTHIKILVLDEADNMLDGQGLSDQCMRVKALLPKTTQLVLFSATFGDRVMNYAEYFAPNANEIRLKQEELTVDGIKQMYLECDTDEQKYNTLVQFYGLLTISSSIIFVNSREAAAEIEKRMTAEGHTIASLTGRIEGSQRDAIIDKFRHGEAKVLITTNVLARGIDVRTVSLVINYDVPTTRAPHSNKLVADCQTYLHRIGRTGRFGRIGVAVTFVSSKQDVQFLKDIEKYFQCDIQKVDGRDWDELEKAVKKIIKSSRARGNFAA